jgi:SAM-dependent methyltransferase
MKTQTHVRCPVCNSDISYVSNNTNSKRRLPKELYAFYTLCPSCNVLFLKKESHDENTKFIFRKADSALANFLISFSNYFKYLGISRFKKNGIVLDIGCGEGFLIDMLSSKGYTVKGIEPDKSIQTKRPEIINKYLESAGLRKESYDIVIMSHSLNYFRDVNKAVSIARSILKEGGMLFIYGPDTSSYQLSICGIDWYGIDIKKQYYLFDKSSQESLLANNGLKCIYAERMLLDSPFSFVNSILKRKIKSECAKKIFYIPLLLAGFVLQLIIPGYRGSFLMVAQK